MAGRTINVRGIPGAKEILDELSDAELVNRTKRATRAGTAVGRRELRAAVKSGEHPRTFRKIATRGHRNPVGTSVGPTSPLLNIFEGGAGVHEIAPGKLTSAGNRAMLLSGAAGDHYRPRDFLASFPVTHPGMTARPLIGPVFDRHNEEMAEAAMAKLFEGIR